MPWALLLFLSLACGLPLEPKGGTGPGIDATPVLAQPTSDPAGTQPDAGAAARHEQLFRAIWDVVDQNYVYPDYNGADWEAVRLAYAPRVAAAPDDAAFWQLMREMIGALGDDHSVFLDPDEVLEEDQAVTGDLDYVGIGVYVTVASDTDYGVVLLTLPGGPAERAGVRAHDRILTVDGVPACCTPEGYDNLDLMQGLPGTQVSLSLQYPGEAPREVQVVRQRIQGQLPVVSRTLEATERPFGYVLIPTLWDETIAERTREALAGLLATGEAGYPVEGLVVDMRTNGGGAYTELADLLSLFVDGEVGTFRRRGDERDPMIVAAQPVGKSQTVPLVILVGAGTESYAEVFSGVLQDLGRAQLVGMRTAGNLETVFPYDLEDGSRLWLAEEVFEPPSGHRWEGEGVQPDIEIPGDWGDFTEASDPQLEAALALLAEEMTTQ